MAVINIKVNGLDAAIAQIDGSIKNIEKNIQGELNAWALETTKLAKQMAPVDEGHLRGAIHPEFGKLKASVTVNVDYAAYIEFGTRKFASSYVASLPSDWQSFAAGFKGKAGGGDVFEFIKRLMGWVKRKGLSGTYSVKTQRRTGKKAERENEDFEVAYAIAMAILRKGIKPHPFLYPAYLKTKPELIENIKKLLQ